MPGFRVFSILFDGLRPDRPIRHGFPLQVRATTGHVRVRYLNMADAAV